jgi:glycosyltransferase 2 family protein
MSAVTVHEAPPAPTPASGRVAWDRRRTLLVLGASLVVAWGIVRRDDVAAGLAVLSDVGPAWMTAAVMAAATAQLAAATALHAVAPASLRFGRVCHIQLAGTAATAVTPGGVGGAALHAGELQRAGSSRAGSWAAVVTVRTVTFLTHVLLLVAALPLLHRTYLPTVEVPTWSIVLAIVGMLAVVAGGSAAPTLRRRARVLWHQRPPTELLRRRTAGLVGGSAGTTLARGVTLWVALQATGGHVPILAVLGLFLVAEAAGTISGAPNGLGAFDMVVLAGLEAAGTSGSAGLAALVLYRLCTVWLPILPGLAALATLRRPS